MKYIIHTDGGSRGNPGLAAVGVVIDTVDGSSTIVDGIKKTTVSFGKTIGVTTNNVAEYTAVIEALKWVGDHQQKGETITIQFLLDSTLVVNQLNGLFKVKDANMRMLMMTVRQLEQGIGGDIRYAYVPRAENSAADFQVNKALDGMI